MTLFLGGWNDPFGILGYFFKQYALAGNTTGLIVLNIVGSGIFVTKCMTLIFVQMWIRWTLPRLRIDQVMMTCLKYLLPISCVLLVGVSLWRLTAPVWLQNYFRYPMALAVIVFVALALIKAIRTPSAMPVAGVPSFWNTGAVTTLQPAQRS